MMTDAARTAVVLGVMTAVFAVAWAIVEWVREGQ